jgi:hypothetical protein
MAEHLTARQRRPSKARRKKRRIGVFSRRLTYSDLDGRTNAGKYVNSIENALEAQIGTPRPGPADPDKARSREDAPLRDDVRPGVVAAGRRGPTRPDRELLI